MRISSAFVTPGPVRVGDIVHLEVTVTFATDTLPNADLIHIFEDGSLQFLGVSQGFVQLACAVFPDTPDSARATILCLLGTLLGPTPLTFSFQAREPTVGTSGESRVGFDLDGPDRQPGSLIGPAVATIEIIDAMTPEALPAMGAQKLFLETYLGRPRESRDGDVPDVVKAFLEHMQQLSPGKTVIDAEPGAMS